MNFKDLIIIILFYFEIKNMKNNLFLLLLFLIIDFSTSIVVLPFHTKTQLTKFSEFNVSNFIKYVSNSLLTDIELGEPPQKLQVSLSGNIYSFEIYQYNSSFYGYDISKSTSFINVTSEKIMPSITTAKDTIYLYNDLNMNNKIQIKNISMLLSKSIELNSTKYDVGIFGIKIWNNNVQIFNKSLIKEIGNLKSQYNFIKNYSWQLKNINDKNFDEWKIIIGEYPHEYDSKNFKEEQLKYTPSADMLQWTLNCHKIKSADTFLQNNYNIPLDFDSINLIASKEYKEFIYQEFFLDYFEKNICFYESYLFDTVYCKKQYFDQNSIKKFPKLEFYEYNLNYTFEFTGNDLFFEKDGYYYFMIGLGTKWSFGLSFLKKYPLIFNHETRSIYYYNENKNDEKNQAGIIINEKVIIGIVVGIIFLAVGLIVGKYFFNTKRKKKANELDDDYDYNQQNEKENKLNQKESIINDD